MDEKYDALANAVRWLCKTGQLVYSENEPHTEELGRILLRIDDGYGWGYADNIPPDIFTALRGLLPRIEPDVDGRGWDCEHGK